MHILLIYSLNFVYQIILNKMVNNMLVYVIEIMFMYLVSALAGMVYTCGQCWCDLKTKKIVLCESTTTISTYVSTVIDSAFTTVTVRDVKSFGEYVATVSIIWFCFELILLVLQYLNVSFIPGFKIFGKRVLWTSVLSPTTIMFVLIGILYVRLRRLETRQREFELHFRDGRINSLSIEDGQEQVPIFDRDEYQCLD